MSKIYFASDFHLGLELNQSSAERERMIVDWLNEVKSDASEIYLVGDLFDFWFEYPSVVPRGFVRFIGKLADLRDKGIQIHLFTGNHDMWMFSYFEEELDITIHRAPIKRRLGNKSFLIGHGDGLGPGDYGYKFIKRIFANPICQWLFARLHPNFAFFIAKFWSQRSREKADRTDTFRSKESEWLAIYADEMSEKETIDYFVFGHRHLPIDCTLKNGKSRYINLGDWMTFRSYAVFDGDDIKLHFYKNAESQVLFL